MGIEFPDFPFAILTRDPHNERYVYLPRKSSLPQRAARYREGKTSNHVPSFYTPSKSANRSGQPPKHRPPIEQIPND